MFRPIDGSITAAKGFKAAGINCGIKKTKKDLGLIFSEVEASAAAVYTENRVKAAPLLVTQEHLKKGRAQAIIINSGCANACTGLKGHEHALRMTQLVAQGLNIPTDLVLVASTGVIGRNLPMDLVEKGIQRLIPLLGSDGGDDVAEAILTTDTVPKRVAVEVQLSDSTVRIGGIAKGSGMIRPNMGTMLAFLTTDARVEEALLRRLLVSSVERSFNLITVDGDTSTNDMVVILANGMAGAHQITGDSRDYDAFCEALDFVTGELAKMIVKDGEGATKFVTVSVRGARNHEEAKRVAFAVAKSSLVKTALFGEDPNWGRIIAAVGASGVEVEERKISLAIDGLVLFEKGEKTDYAEREARRIFSNPSIKIQINLNQGTESINVYTCDLSYDYVKINAEYTT
ncbi:MAG TPA: bifunctional glutamate N-acetyltransferase/amino-acid acetyltransferase ArgJ [Candidatus Latescibacteria bacterium]|nr:bifunctional glutamate N-acetyltransferase/amino-acid acetyltransferase ArgJ [Candidatus Latescibacterota bacterium]